MADLWLRHSEGLEELRMLDGKLDDLDPCQTPQEETDRR